MVLCHSRFVWRVCVPTGSRVLGITVVYLFEILGWSSLMFGNFRLTAVLHALICLLDRNTVAWYPFSLIFVPFLSCFNNFMKLCRFSFIWQIVFFPVPVFFVLHWYISSRSLVGQRWCLRWCSVIFVWLQFYIRSFACWIATLWHDTYAVWDSSALRECFISFFESLSVFVYFACLSLNWSSRSWYYSGTLFRASWLVSVDVWREDR